MKIRKFKQLNENNTFDGVEIKKIFTDYMNTLYGITEFMRIEKIISERDYAKEWWYDDDDIYFEVYIVDELDESEVGNFHFGKEEIDNLSRFLNNKEEYINSKKYNL